MMKFRSNTSDLKLKVVFFVITLNYEFTEEGFDEDSLLLITFSIQTLLSEHVLAHGQFLGVTPFHHRK